MHILMVSLDYIPTVGGITAHVHELSKALTSIGCKVSVATKFVASEQKEFETSENIDIYRFKLKYFGLTYGYQINNFIKELTTKHKFDIIHIHGMRPLEFYSIKDIPLAYTNHTSGFLKRIKKGGYRLSILKRLFKKPDLFLAPSQELLEIPFSIRAKKKFISNGVISDRFSRDEDVRKNLRTELKITDDEKLAIVTRRMVWKNGVSYLAKATQHIKNRKLKLLFIGDGEEFNSIKEILEKYFANRYILLGAKKHHEIIDYYSAADLSILPSLMEATSISGLEAMAASLPLVGTDVGGIPIILKDGVNGYLCESADEKSLALTIDKLLDSNLEKMGKQSKKMVDEDFDWLTIAKQTFEQYETIV